MEWTNIEIRVPKEMLPFLLTENTLDVLRRNALILYPYIKDLTISHGRAAEILGIPKWDLIELYEDMGLPYLDMDISEVEKELDVELVLNGADQASKETDVRYHHKEVFSKVRRSISEK